MSNMLASVNLWTGLDKNFFESQDFYDVTIHHDDVILTSFVMM